MKMIVIISPKFENFGDIMFLVAPPPSPPSPPSPPPPHANACTGHNFVNNRFYTNQIHIRHSHWGPRLQEPYDFWHQSKKTKWPLAAILYKNAQKACGFSNSVINSPINFIFGIAIDNPIVFWGKSDFQNGHRRKKKNSKKKITYRSEMVRNVIESDFRSSKMAVLWKKLQKKVAYWSEMARNAI